MFTVVPTQQPAVVAPGLRTGNKSLPQDISVVRTYYSLSLSIISIIYARILMCIYIYTHTHTRRIRNMDIMLIYY